jgi:hypothetical protein
MPALFGYLVAVSMLLGGAYAGLQWLSAPGTVPAEKSAAHSRNAPDKPVPTRMGAVAVPNAADRQANAGNPGNTASVERTDEIDHEAKHTDPVSTGQSSKLAKVDAVTSGGCAPIGLTANGDLVFSMQCQEMIERHRRELATSEASSTAPAITEDQAARSANTNTGSDEDRGKRVATQSENHDRNAEQRVAGREPDRGRAEPVVDGHAGGTPQASGITDESRSGPKPDVEATPRKPLKQQMARTKPETSSRTIERHDAAERHSPVSRSRRMAARGDSELWYNVLGLR